MKLFACFYKTAFYLAVEEENIEIIKMFLKNNKLDVNIINIPYKYIYKIYIQLF